MMNISIRSLMSTIALVGFSCAPVKNQSSVTRSLDNLAATDGGYTTNICGANHKSLASVPAVTKLYKNRIMSWDQSLQLATLNALHHVPLAISKPFFDQGGTIEISPNSTETCQNSNLTAKERKYIKEGGKKVDSCWIQPAKGKPPVIVLPNESPRIRHNLLRVMVYFYNEYLIDRINKQASANKSTHANVNEGLLLLNTKKNLLTEAFLEDAASYNFYASKKLWDLRSESALRFDNMVLAEAIDSFYCNAETYGKFTTSFKRTFTVFTEKKPDSLANLLGVPVFRK